MSLHERLRKHWQGQGIASDGGLPITDITTFERQHNVSMPQDLREFLHEFNGTHDMGGTDHFRFLPLQEYTSSLDNPVMPFGMSFEITYPQVPNGFFVFADYLQWCYGYAIQLGKTATTNPVVLIGGLTCPLISNSFSEFMELYLREDRTLHPKVSP